jgi:hypothetical protein
LLPRPRAQEVIELDATCEVVDEPDQAGEGALGDQLEPVRRGEPRGQGSADYRRVDRSTIEDQGLNAYTAAWAGSPGSDPERIASMPSLPSPSR